jgi:hypothetical protein
LTKYEEAVSRAYRYLLVNLKPRTAESQMLKTDILSSKSRIGLHEIRNVIRGEAEPIPQPSELRNAIRREAEPIPQPSERKYITRVILT